MSASVISSAFALLFKLADWIDANAQRLIQVDALDIGRTVQELPYDYYLAAGQYRFFASALAAHDGWNSSSPAGWMIARREPLGVVGQIILWNVPADNHPVDFRCALKNGEDLGGHGKSHRHAHAAPDSPSGWGSHCPFRV